MTISEGSPMHRRTLLAVLAAMAIVVASFATMASHAAPASAATSGTYFVTLYGWPDNSPPGGAIAYPGLHSTAGGTGTFSDPITFATDRSEIAPGTKVYYSFLKRYFIMEDDCAQCDQDWNGGGADKFQIVYPSNSILAEPPVAVIDKNVDRHGTRKVAEAYLQFLYTPQAQEIEAKDFYRPRDQSILAAHAAVFPKIPLYTIDDVFGGWTKAQQVHFSDGGVFDQIYKPGQ